MIIEPSAASPEDRRSRKKQRTRRAILSAARGLAAKEPLAAVAIELITEAADISRATFFLHFPSKPELLRCLESELAAELKDVMVPVAGRSAEHFQQGLQQLFEWGAVAGDLLRASLDAPDKARGPLVVVLEEFARVGQQRGDLRRDVAPESVARMLAGALAAMLSADRAGAIGGDELRREELTALLLNGLREPKPRLKWSAHANRTSSLAP